MIAAEATENTEVEITGVGTHTMKPISVETVARIVGAQVSGVEPGASHISGVSTDSRTIRPGDCFFAIAGESFDGHSYVREVLQKGAACAVVGRSMDGETMPGVVLRVADTVAALGDLAREYRRMNAFKVVAITGSVGKTTTRQIIHHVLSRHFRTHQAQKSFNNNIGLPLTLLGAGPDVEVIVAELGANHPGEIAYLTRIAQPDIALVTNVYPAHLEGFGDLATIVREKLSIAEGLPSDGALIINADIEALVAAARNSAMICGEGVPPSNRGQSLPRACRGDARDTQGQDALATRGRCFRTFGKSADATYRAENILCRGMDSTFTIGGTPVHLPLPGPGNVENALAAWAVCDRLGVTIAEFAEAIESLPSVSMRAEPVRVGTLTVLNDCYNANPASMKNALAMLRNLHSDHDDVGRPPEEVPVARASCPCSFSSSDATNKGGTPSPRPRLVFICGEMAELGPQSEALHAELGVAVAQAGVDLLVTVGEPPRVTARVARETARHDLQTISFADTASLCDRMQEFIHPDDIVLVKGSRVARLERVVEKLMKDYE